MRQARPLLLAALLAVAAGLAAASCPAGLRPIKESEKSAAFIAGAAAFAANARDQVCKFFPEFIEPKGLEYYNFNMTPACTDGKGKFTYAPISYRNPCNASQQDFAYMTVDESPKGCLQGPILPLSTYGTATPASQVSQMRPIKCPPGYRAARNSELATSLSADLVSFFLNPELILPILDTTSAQQWCSDIGFKRIELSGLSGCITKTATAADTGVMVQGVFKYVCAQQARIHTLGLTLAGDYKRGCVEGDVTIAPNSA